MKRVWYHGNCYDGFGAAWAASKALGRGEDVVYEAVSYGKLPPPAAAGDEIYIVDFSFPRDVLRDIYSWAGKLVVLDHHQTAEEALRGLDFCVFDMSRSGAGITWDYFHPGVKRPLLIDMIEDRDLWRWKVDGSKALHAYLLSKPFDFDVWDSIDDSLTRDPSVVIHLGSSLLDYQASLVEKVATKSWLGEIDGHKVALCNIASHWSEIGEALVAKYPEAAFSASFTVMPDLTVMWSLRSRTDFDVSVVAKKFGGGGHKQAAGFKAPLESISFIGRGVAYP